MTTRMVLAGLVIGLLGVPLTAEQRPGQPARGRAPQVQLVQTVGCVEQRARGCRLVAGPRRGPSAAWCCNGDAGRGVQRGQSRWRR